MGRVGYTKAQMAEAVALAKIIGAEAAATQLGIGNWRTVRRWMVKAGNDMDEHLATPDEWRKIGDLAKARGMAWLASGKASGPQLLIAAGIAERNTRAPAVVAKVTSAMTEADTLEASWTKAHGPELLDVCVIAFMDGADPLTMAADDLTDYLDARRLQRSAEAAAQLVLNAEAAQRLAVEALLRRAAEYLGGPA